MPVTLTSKHIYPTPPQPVAVPVQFIKPLTYEFRVAEIVEDGKVTSVKLQVQTFEHDEFGSGVMKTYWSDVPRIRMDTSGNIL